MALPWAKPAHHDPTQPMSTPSQPTTHPPTCERLPVVSYVEAIHGVAPNRVHLSRHDVKVDVLEHTHNVCGASTVSGQA